MNSADLQESFHFDHDSMFKIELLTTLIGALIIVVSLNISCNNEPLDFQHTILGYPAIVSTYFL
jgi:hypothetical protein